MKRVPEVERVLVAVSTRIAASAPTATESVVVPVLPNCAHADGSRQRQRITKGKRAFHRFRFFSPLIK